MMKAKGDGQKELPILSERDKHRRTLTLAKWDCYSNHNSALHSALVTATFDHALTHIRAMVRDLQLMEAIIRDVAADQVLSGDKEPNDGTQAQSS